MMLVNHIHSLIVYSSSNGHASFLLHFVPNFVCFMVSFLSFVLTQRFYLFYILSMQQLIIMHIISFFFSFNHFDKHNDMLEIS
jgi:hypothetical protein